MKKIEDAYNEMSYIAKEDIGWPQAYIFLTREQESFILELFNTEREAVKKALQESLEEMKGLVDEL